MLWWLVFSGTSVAQSKKYQSQQHNFKTTVVVDRLNFPWGLAFLPNADMLVTERVGRLRLVQNGVLNPEPISGLPPNIYAAGQGGLLDVALHPNFVQNKWVYFSYAGRGAGGAGTEVARGRLNGTKLENTEVIFRVVPKTKGGVHFGSRLVFIADGTLLITVGERGMKKQAQDPTNHLGSVMRIHDDGTVPKNNPWVDHSSNQPEIYSYGHRNVQGIAVRASNKSVWTHEHGPRGGDEVNILHAGANYGWPVITYGINYSGTSITDKTEAPGLEQPVIYWVPSIAPSGMAFYTGNRFQKWKGNLFVGALAKTHLRRLVLEGDKIVHQEILLPNLARVRDVRNGPDGYLYILTDARNGKIIRLEPAD